MRKIRLAVIVGAHRELRLTAGEVGRGKPGAPDFEHLEEEIQTLDGPAFLKVGLAQLGSVHIFGPEVVNVSWPQDSLSLSWYLPGEEGPEEARPIKLSSVGLIPESPRRPPAEPGHVWRFRVEGWGPIEQTMVFKEGFQPPFVPSDLTLMLTSLSAYGFDSMVLTRLLYRHRAPAYTEGDMGISDLIAEGVLSD